MFRPRAMVGVLLLLTAACASHNSAAGAAPAESAPGARIRPDVISEEELSDPSLGDADALSIIKRLRPSFLSWRGPVSVKNSEGGTVHISLDGAGLKTADVLTSVHVRDIKEIRYLNAPAAAQRFGTPSGAGPVIIIVRR